MKSILTVLIIISIAGCGTRKNKELQDPVNSPAEFSEILDTLLIEKNIAIIWWPDSIDQIVMKKNYDEISYNTFVDDLTWYTQRAVNMLDSFDIESRVTDKDVIIFKKQDNSQVIMNRKEIKGNLVLFNTTVDPFVANVNEYNRSQVLGYFGRK